MQLLTVCVLGLALTLGLPSSLAAQTENEDPGESGAPSAGSQDAPVMIAIPDSLRPVYTASEDAPLEMEIFEVRERRIVRELGADRVELGRGLIDSRDGGSVADLGTLLPSTHLSVNSRGEALFMVRGSSERHLRVELDGIPLTLPWDERTDLSLLPLLGVGRVNAHRGVNSVLDPPNALAGVISLESRSQPVPGNSTRLGTWAGEAEAYGLQLLHTRQDGAWNSTLALEHRQRSGLLLPATVDVDYFADDRRFENQDPSRRVRTNSDLRQTALLARLARAWGDTGNLRLLVQASDGEKGVAPEMHEEAADARFWRYPQTRRLLLGLGARHAVGSWDVDAAASVDLHRQDIDKYDDSAYQTITGFENGRDRTLLGRLQLRHRFGERFDLTVRGTLRHALRDQEEDGLAEDLRFAQTLGGLATEGVYRPTDRWSLRAGVGYEGARTPNTGDKPSRAADQEIVLHAAAEREVGARGRLHAAVSRRPRFPSLRELFNEALDRFLVNPDLRPERQTAVELGYSHRTANTEFNVNGFAQSIDGAIERINVDVDGTRLRQRVNLDEVRNLGLEMGFVVRPMQGLSLDWQHTQLYSRSKVDGDFDARVEDRPDWLTTLAASYTHPGGVGLRSELVGVGRRFSLGTEGLVPLDTALRLNLRLSYRDFGFDSIYAGSEVFLRLDNVFDSTTESQIGLLESGRTIRVGVRLDLQG